MTEVASLVIKVDSSLSKRATADLDRLAERADRTERAANKLGKAWGVALGLVSSAAIVGATRAFIRQADAMANLNARLGLVTDSAEGLARAQQDVFDISQRTATDMGATADLYTKIAQSSDELAGNQARLASVTETVSQALVVSGADAASTAAVIRQFSQALASGALRGDEFVSVMEGAPRLARAIADGLNVPIGKLRELAAQGELTADKIITALEDQGAAVDREFGRMPLTVSRATEKVENALQMMIGKTDEASDASAGLATAIDELASLLSEPETQQAFVDTATAIAKITTNALAGARAVAQLGKDMAAAFGERDLAQQIIDKRMQIFNREQVFGEGSAKGLREELDALREQYANSGQKAADESDWLKYRGLPEDNGLNVRPPGVSSGGRSFGGSTSRATDRVREQTSAVKELTTAEEELAWIEEQWAQGAIDGHNRRATAWWEETRAVEKATDKMSTLWDEAARSMQGALADFLFDPSKDGMDSMADHFAQTLKRMMADLASSKLLEAFGSWASGYTGAGSGWINALGSAIGGGRAGGGPVMAGQSYVVGDGGEPELFTPSGNGTVTPLSKLGGTTTANVKLEVINNGQPVKAETTQQQMPDGSQLIKLVLNAVGDSFASGTGAPYAAAKGRFGLRDAV